MNQMMNTMDDGLALETVHLRKEFGRKVAVEDLTLTVPRGEVFGFLGPNGAGKTTAIKMLMGLVYPTSGEARILGIVAQGPASQGQGRFPSRAVSLPRLAHGRGVPGFPRPALRDAG